MGGYSDEIDFALDVLRPYASHTLFINPLACLGFAVCRLSVNHRGSSATYRIHGHCGSSPCIGRHWVQCDVFAHGQTLFVLFTNTLPESADPQTIANAFCSAHKQCHFRSGDAPTPKGMCGWALLGRLFDRYRIPFPIVSRQMTQALFQSQFSQLLSLILDRANEAWADSTDDSSLRKLAYSVRANFLRRILSKPGPAEYLSAGAPDADASMPPATTVAGPIDPLTVHDPWAQAVRQSSKWEDLKLIASRPPLRRLSQQIPATDSSPPGFEESGWCDPCLQRDHR